MVAAGFSVESSTPDLSIEPAWICVSKQFCLQSAAEAERIGMSQIDML